MINYFPFVFQAYLDKSNKQIEDLVRLVRGSLNKGERATVCALIVIDVHGNSKSNTKLKLKTKCLENKLI